MPLSKWSGICGLCKQPIGFDTNIKHVFTIGEAKYCPKCYKNIPKDFSLDELKSTSLREKELSEVRSLAVLAHFLQLQEQASILGNVNKILNADRAKPKFLHQSAVRYNAKTTLEFNDILPKEVLDKLYNNTSTSAFNNQKTGIDKFITQLFGGKQVFDVTNHPTFNEFI